MEVIYNLTLILAAIMVVAAIFIFSNHHKRRGDEKLPPGTMGWPLIGETWEFLSCGWKGKPEKFVMERLPNHASPCMAFKTSLFGEKFIVMGGAMANKLVFSNENKLVQLWWPKSVQKLITSDFGDHLLIKRVRKLLQPFFMPEALQRYIPTMDIIANQHFTSEWENKDKVTVYPLCKRYTFWLACHIFLAIQDPNEVAQLFGPFKDLTAAIISLPINVPGTTYNQGIKASNLIKMKIKDIIKQRKADLTNGKASSTQDILSQMLLASDDEDGRCLSETVIVDSILGFLIGGYDTGSGVCTLIIKYLAEFPQVYDSIYQEQMEVARSKANGDDMLNWKDIQKMKYSWNVACEVLRLHPSTPGVFRESIKDFTFDGFRIPKGWKILSSVYTTHSNPQCFPNPERFDPSRFNDSAAAPYTFIPFGGGPRMCIGMEFAKLEILVFMHNLVKRFKWEKMASNETIIMKPFPRPSQSLPIRLYPHHHAPIY